MSLREYVEFIRAGRWWIGAGLILGISLGIVGTLQAPTLYSSSTTLYFVAVNGGGDPGQAYQGSILAEQKALAYSKLLTSQRVMDDVSEAVGRSVSAGAVDVQVVAGNPTLIVQATDRSPVEAARIANEVADEGAQLVAELERPKDRALTSVVEMRVVTPATEPSAPTSPVLLDNLAAGVLLGLAGGFLAAMVRTKLDQSLRTAAALEAAAGRPSLGDLPHDPAVQSYPFIVDSDPRSHLSESIRQLQINLRFAASEQPSTSLLVTSAAPTEGKTLVAVNLAIGFALEGSRVLLIDADLRRSRMAAMLGLTSRFGLSAVLRDETPFDEAVVRWRDGLLDVLLAGPAPQNPSDLLTPARISALLDEVEPLYDVVVVDSPALLPVADGTALAGSCDATLLLVRHGLTTTSEVESAAATLSRASARLVGCAFTLTPQSSRLSRGHQYYASAPRPTDAVPSIDAANPSEPERDTAMIKTPAPPNGVHAESAPRSVLDAAPSDVALASQPPLTGCGASIDCQPSPRPRVSFGKALDTATCNREEPPATADRAARN